MDLYFFKVYERKAILEAIKEQLSYEPLKETKHRKELRENPLANWELRFGEYRVFYEVRESIHTVGIMAIGWKFHNVLYIRNKEVKI